MYRKDRGDKVKKVIMIAGPTGTGKTALAIKLCQALQGEVIGADSVQIYHQMDIGSAKVTKEEAQNIPHHLIDIVDPSTSYSVENYQTDALACIDAILARGRVPVMVGGTGLYFSSILYDWDFQMTAPNPSLRYELETLYQQKGLQALLDRLESVQTDENLSFLDTQNPRRVMRVLEILESGGTLERNNHKKLRSGYQFCAYALSRDRAQMYERINARVDDMMQDGLLTEAKALYDRNLPRQLPSQRAIGYKELFRYFDGQCTLNEAVERIKIHSRQYAKRQVTWFKHQGDFKPIVLTEDTDIEDVVFSIIEDFKGEPN